MNSFVPKLVGDSCEWLEFESPSQLVCSSRLDFHKTGRGDSGDCSDCGGDSRGGGASRHSGNSVTVGRGDDGDS
jgi:hypothetical protein